MLTRLIPAAALALLLGNSMIACSDAKNVVSCAQVCDKYKDCINSDYDVASCTSNCEDKANDSDDRQDQLDSCNSCIEDRSCTSAVFNCTDECATVISSAS
ncbi:MAG TPA: hypothetical protein VFS67_22875 [Polyangiaceae bacterium]|jgi:hypothetical protein|nr:hypothetical protein [Polyangiaceae bacterium]